ncbi:penicillin-binding protein [Bacillus sp. AFS015802]|uniref:serine hydrolase domain-containing protein n=1 Tax=Bacillus sp. AFS015802 TaxID=2033486 RepID=UPI000BF51A7A|nr:serine hydrolase domain-containing protein [Bacillus sp. AFS015802]PFA66480.1 penicillin-binding protein [Bacillus sp. AFS015802]
MRKAVLTIGLICCMAILFHSHVHAEGINQKEELINQFMKDSMKEYEIPGASLAIVQDGKLLFQQSYGKQSNGNRVTDETTFAIGSISKPLTSLAIMKLLEDGKIELDQEISRYLPDFHYNQTESNKEITIRHLLTHTSGISSYDGLALADRNLRGEAAIDTAVQELNNVPLSHEPGTVHEYSPANYLLLGRIIENVTNQTFSSFMDSEIFNRIGMKRTASNFEEAQALGYQPGFQSWLGKPIKSKGFMDDSGVPYGYLVSTSGDMSKFIRFMMDGDDKWLSHKTFSMYTSPQVHRKEDMYYGYGWRISASKDEPYYFHGGETPDYRSELFINPKQNYGFILLTNKNNFSEVLSTVWMRDGIRTILEEGKMPDVKTMDHHLQWSALLITVFLLMLCCWNLYRLRTKTSIKKRRWIFTGTFSVIFAFGLIPSITYFFYTPWHSINLYAPDIAFFINLVVGILTLYGSLCWLGALLKRKEEGY